MTLISLVALGSPMFAGCGEDSGTPGVACERDVCSCDELGIRTAIALGGGPYTFDCSSPTTVVTEATIVIDKDVIVDGEGDLTVDGNEDHRVFFVMEEITAELHGLRLARGNASGDRTFQSQGWGGGIFNEGSLTLVNSSVSGSSASGNGGGIYSGGGPYPGALLNLVNTTVSGNRALAGQGGGIHSTGRATLINSTVSGNSAAMSGGGIAIRYELTLVNSTVSENTGSAITAGYPGSSTSIEMARTLIDGECNGYGDPHASPKSDPDPVSWISRGYNVESPGNTCGFRQETDLPGIPRGQLSLGPLGDHGGPTQTHALGADSPAIDVVPGTECLDVDGEPLRTDQRGEPRPAGDDAKCDVGAFEVQEGDQ